MMAENILEIEPVWSVRGIPGKGWDLPLPEEGTGAILYPDRTHQRGVHHPAGPGSRIRQREGDPASELNPVHMG